MEIVDHRITFAVTQPIHCPLKDLNGITSEALKGQYRQQARSSAGVNGANYLTASEYLGITLRMGSVMSAVPQTGSSSCGFLNPLNGGLRGLERGRE